jgi:hypothetical protein
MKRILSIIGCIIVLAASSCTKKYVTPNPNIVVFKTINASDWVLYTNSNTGQQAYSAALNVAELVPDFNNYGGVIVSIAYTPSDSPDVVYEQLPEVFEGTSFSYTYNAGGLAIYAQAPNGATAVKPTAPISVKIVLVATGN